MHAKGRTNCPNCGAPINSTQCTHCGTIFYDFGAIEVGKPTWFRLMFEDKVYIFKGIANADIHIEEPEPITMYSDDCPIMVMKTQEFPDVTVNLEIRSINGIEEGDNVRITAGPEALK